MKVLLLLMLFQMIPISAFALDIQAPPVPESASKWMPQNTESFSEGLIELWEDAALILRPELCQAIHTGISVLIVAILISVIKIMFGKEKLIAEIAGVVIVSLLILQSSKSMIILATDTIRELCSYGKLLFPVMAAAMAAHGGVTASAALYSGTVVLDSFLGSLMSNILIPGIYLFVSAAVAYSATREKLLKRIRDAIKNAVSWCLKTLLTIFTTYMSITGVVSGTTDAAALKAAKVTISSVVPVVGGILSDASESVVLSAGLMKNAAGIYGILAVLALFLEPFLTVAVQYLTLKAVSALCSVFSEGAITTLAEDFSSAMGLLLAMTGSVCLLLLISTVCFMKGVG